jgi:hypothetical protein
MNTIIVKLDDLLLDPNNYRLRSNPKFSLKNDNVFDKPQIQKGTYSLLTGDNNFNIYDLIESIKSNGFLKVDQILVRPYKSTKKYVVIEGNRRVAALKFLKEEYSRGFEIGKLDPQIFIKGVETVLYEYQNPNDYLILQGLRHVSGNKKWDRYNQARLLYELNQKQEFKNPLEISRRIGYGNKKSIERDIKTYEAIQEFVDYVDSEGLWHSVNPTEKFEIFYELVGKESLLKWLSYDFDSKPHFQNSKRKAKFFSWLLPSVTDGSDEEDGEELQKPIIYNHKHLRILDELINEKGFVDKLEELRDAEAARDENISYLNKTAVQTLEDIIHRLKSIPSGAIVSLTEKDRVKLNEIVKLCNAYSNLKD